MSAALRRLVAAAALILHFAAQAQPAGKDSPAFDVFEYRVEGNSVLSPLAIERAVYPHLGEKRHISDVEAARAALEKAYRDAGYSTVVVDVPVQKVDEGVVVLRVIEGKVERARVTGSRYYSRGRILEGTGALAEGEVPFFPALQADLGQLNTSPDRRVTPLLRPGSLPGATELELKVDDRLPLHGGLELNNRYSPNTTHTRLSANVRYDNLFQRQHSVGLQLQVSPEQTDEVRVLFANYAMPLRESGGTLYGYFVASDSNVAAIGGVTVLGKGQIAGLRAGWPLASRSGWSQSLTLGVDQKRFEDVVTQPGTPGFQTPIHYLPFSLDYAAFRQDSRSSSRGSLGLVFSFRGVGNDPSEFADKRFKAQPNFLLLRWGAEHTHALGKSYSLTLRAEGQLADQPLISNEQFFAGGIASVRGYLEAEVIGDAGVRLSSELRGPSLARGGGWLGEARPLVFLEGAYLHVQDPLPEQQDSFNISSAGFGLRAKAGEGFDLWLNVAWPFRTTVYTNRHEARGQFVGSYRF